jgi:predicted TIM-barrel fold metal-dependent hydrolase
MTDVTRRSVLKMIAGAGAAGALPFAAMAGQDSRDAAGAPSDKRPVPPLQTKGGAIDVHHHLRPKIEGAAGNPNWTPAMSIEHMDKFNIAAAVLSLTMMRPQIYDGTEKGRALVRSINDFGAKCVQYNPKRFGLFASIPMPDIDGTLREIEYAYDILKADGISFYSSTGDRWPGDPFFDPIMQDLNRRRTIVFIHAAVSNCCLQFPQGISTGELDFDEARAVQSLLVNGVLTKYPNIRFILFHGGGVVPAMAGRIKDRYPRDRTQWIPNGVFAELRKFYYELGHGNYRHHLVGLKEFVPATQVLFGTDFTPEPMETTVREMHNTPYSRAELQMIERTNAERLWPRFKV